MGDVKPFIGEDGYYHFIYCTTNLVTGRCYVGVHTTHDYNDNYLGSGKLIGSAIKKYGKCCFERQFLEFFRDRDSMFEKEDDYIAELTDIFGKEMMYNINTGGNAPPIMRGEEHPLFGKKHSRESIKKMSEKHKGKVCPESVRQKIADANKGINRGGENPSARAIFFRGSWYECMKDAMQEHFPDMEIESARYRINRELSGHVVTGVRKGENHPHFGKEFSEEVRKRMSEGKKGKYIGGKSPNAKPVVFRGKIYECMGDVISEHFQGVPRTTARRRIQEEINSTKIQK